VAIEDMRREGERSVKSLSIGDRHAALQGGKCSNANSRIACCSSSTKGEHRVVEPRGPCQYRADDDRHQIQRQRRDVGRCSLALHLRPARRATGRLGTGYFRQAEAAWTCRLISAKWSPSPQKT